MQLANFFALQPYVEVYLYILNNYTTMALNTYFKVIVFEIFVFEYDFRCTRTRTRESPYLPSSGVNFPKGLLERPVDLTLFFL